MFVFKFVSYWLRRRGDGAGCCACCFLFNSLPLLCEDRDEQCGSVDTTVGGLCVNPCLQFGQDWATWTSTAAPAANQEEQGSKGNDGGASTDLT